MQIHEITLQLNENALGDFGHGDIDGVAVHTQPGGQDGDKDVGIDKNREIPIERQIDRQKDRQVDR
jgi:hypothetical protein